MPKKVQLVVRFKDPEPIRLIIWELIRLHDDMRVAANPEAERLERILRRFAQLEDEPR